MLPIRDINPSRTTPWVNYALIVVNIGFFVWELSLGVNLGGTFERIGFIPSRFWITGFWVPDGISMLVSMFLHGGFLHLGSNMLYLWIFGDNIEDRMGHGKYFVFYLACGVAATFAHAVTNSSSTVPAVGASGSIAGVLGAYLVLFPHAKVTTFIPIGFFLILRELPALIVLGLWFVFQLFTGVASLGGPEAGGVAWFAHIGGFVAGLLLVSTFTMTGPKASAERYFR